MTSMAEMQAQFQRGFLLSLFGASSLIQCLRVRPQCSLGSGSPDPDWPPWREQTLSPTSLAGSGSLRIFTDMLLLHLILNLFLSSKLTRDGHMKQVNVVISTLASLSHFNLNVQVYEPNPTAYQVLNNEEEENRNHAAETEGSAALPVRYPSNHRYYNCGDGYDDQEDEMAYEDSDIDDYEDDDDNEFDDDEYDWDDDGCDGSLENDEAEVCDANTKQKELAESCYPSLAEDKIRNQMLDEAELKSNLSGGDRSKDMHSVLIPVENLTQWKAIKTKVVSSSKHTRKENVPSKQHTNMPLVSEASLNFSPCSLESNALQSMPLLPEIAVDASLSNCMDSNFKGGRIKF